MMPPLITVGSRCAASSTAAIRLVVVVLPCVPPIAIDHFSRISSASISARRTTGISRARAVATSGLSGLHRGRHDHDLRAAEIGGVMADGDGNAGLAQAADIGGIGDVAALHRVAEIVQHLGDAGHADAADADEVDGADGKRQGPHAPCLLAHEVLDEIGEPCGGIRRGRCCARRRARVAEHVRRSQQRGEPVAQCVGGEVPLRDHRCAARLGQRARIGRLMIVDRTRQRHQDGRPAGDRQFGDGGGAGARDHQVRRRQASRPRRGRTRRARHRCRPGRRPREPAPGPPAGIAARPQTRDSSASGSDASAVGTTSLNTRAPSEPPSTSRRIVVRGRHVWHARRARRSPGAPGCR